MRLECLRTVIQSGDASYPIFIAFSTAHEIARIAEAPAFSETTSNATIANNVLTPPVDSWQRPLIETSISAITTTFDNSGRLMPNSVLLARNPKSAHQLSPTQQTVGGTTPTGIWEVEVPSPAPSEPKPLWILDGQHRIHGLDNSLQRDNPIPLVLLLNDETNSYSDSRLAEIFAQVTTTAASLDPLHHEWMSFAFKLEKYSPAGRDPGAQRSAMETTALMCNMPQLNSDGIANPFRDRIKFNPNKSPEGFSAGFAFDCVDMQKLLYRAYFSATPEQGVVRLDEETVARQIGLAYIALQQKVKAPQNMTVFFGERKEVAQRIMQEAFIVGVCTRLLQKTLPIDWSSLLTKLKFNTANWNFKPWVVSVSGAEQRISKAIAETVFRNAFTEGELTGQADLVDILRGDDANFKVMIEAAKPNGRVDPEGTDQRTLVQGSKLNVACLIGARRRLKIVEISANIGRIDAIDSGASTAARRVKLDQIKRRGIILDPAVTPPVFKNPLSVKFVLHFYGGVTAEADLDVDWKEEDEIV